MAELYPHFNERLRDTLTILLGEKLTKRVRISLAKDGSGVGGQSTFSSLSHGTASPVLVLTNLPPMTTAALAALQAKKDIDTLAAKK